LRIIVRHAGEQREQVRRLDRHQTGIRQFDGLFKVRRVLLFDHLYDATAFDNHAAIACGVFRRERQYDHVRRVGVVQYFVHRLHCRRRHERNIAVKNEDIPIKASQRVLCLLHGVPCSMLRFLHGQFCGPCQGSPKLTLATADDHNFFGRT
jgi:hypothetical protein